ncbi:MAG TPA: hypothetical protein VM054_08155 [bacterium]|nr:hypothetical protein [bacterium]
MGSSEYETYRRELEREGRIALWTLLSVGLAGVTFAVVHGARTGFTQGEIWFTLIFGLFVLVDAFFLTPIYRYLAAAWVRRRQRLRGDPVDEEPDATVVRWVDTKDVEDLLKEEPENRGKG